MRNRIHIIGKKNSGKTTLIVELVGQLRQLGYRVGTIKHTHHRHELDIPGKDSYRHREAGAETTAIVSPGTTAVFWPADPQRPSSQRYDELSPNFARCDLVLVEGDARAAGPKIEVWRAAVSDTPLAAADSGIHALVTDDTAPVSVPIWSRSDVATLSRRLLGILGLDRTS